MKKTRIIALAAASTLASLPAVADPVTLTFEGVGNLASVNDFYNGGTDSEGNSGPNYGINFSALSLGLIDSDAGGSGNTANEPSPETTLVFLDGGAATMNVAAGFDTGFSFFYSSNSTNGFVNVYSGLNATGSILATINLAQQFNTNCAGDPNGLYCHWDPIGVSFDGLAHSVDFGGTANYIAFDNITIGAATPGGGAVPEPASWAMMVMGFGLVGAVSRRRTIGLIQSV